MTDIAILVGDLGGGKTTLAKVMGMVEQELLPNDPVISNVVMGSGMIPISNAHEWIMKKLLVKDKQHATVLDDEAAQAGLESRGSGSKASGYEARVITHARKAHIDLVLVSQLKSMLDKRAQWVEDFSVYCERKFNEGNWTELPDYFEYTVFDKALVEIGGWQFDTIDMIKYVWPGMDTDDIPDFQKFKQEMMHYYDINEADLEDFRSNLGIPLSLWRRPS